MRSFTAVCSASLLAAAGWAATFSYPSVHYRIDARYDAEGRRLAGTEVVTATNGSPGELSELRLLIYPNRRYSEGERWAVEIAGAYFRQPVFEGGPGGEPEDGWLRCSGVTVNGLPARAEVVGKGETTLLVVPERPIKPGERFSVACSFELSLAESAAFWGIKENVLRLAYWHPILAVHDEEGWHDHPLELVHQPFFFEAADWDVSLDMPAGWVAAAPGEPLPTEYRGDREVYRWRVGPARDFSVAASPRYRVLTGKAGETEVSVYVLPEDEESGRAALSYACEALSYYSDRFGPYPMRRFNVAEVHLAWLGNEFSGQVFIDRRGFRLPKLLARHLDFLVCHETAHQWWYMQVGNDQYRAAFLDEALATFCEEDYLEAKYGSGDNYYTLPRLLSFLPTTSFIEARRTRYLDYARAGRDERVLTSLPDWGTPEAAFVMSYDKGMLFLRMLRARLGEEAFEAGLRSYLEKFRWRTATVDGLRGAMEEAGGQDLKSFFHDWLETDEELDYALARPERRREGDAWKTTLTVERRGEIRSEIDLLCRFADGGERSLRLTGESAGEQVVLESDSPLVSAELDPEGRLLDARRINNAWPRPSRWRLSPYYAAIYDVPALNRSEKREILVGVPANYFNAGLHASVRELYDWSAFADARWDFHHSGIIYKAGGVLEHVTGPDDTLSLETWRFVPLDEGGERTKGLALSWHRKRGPAISAVEPLENGFGGFFRREDLWDDGVDERTAEVGATWEADLRTPTWSPTRGFKVKALLGRGDEFLGGQEDFTEAVLDGRIYRKLPWGREHVIALRGEGAFTAPALPKRYALGGPEALRGFADGAYDTGRMLLAQAEYRWLLADAGARPVAWRYLSFNRLYGVLFYEAARSWEHSWNEGFVKQDVGLGLRFDTTALGFFERSVLRLDVATPTSGSDGAGVQVFVKFGQAF